MKIYRLTATIWDYWFTPYNSGYKGIEKFYTTREKAEKWIEEHSTFCYGYNTNVAKEDYQFPKFEIEEIKVE